MSLRCGFLQSVQVWGTRVTCPEDSAIGRKDPIQRPSAAGADTPGERRSMLSAERDGPELVLKTILAVKQDLKEMFQGGAFQAAISEAYRRVEFTCPVQCQRTPILSPLQSLGVWLSR
jgi:hypothetical protein